MTELERKQDRRHRRRRRGGELERLAPENVKRVVRGAADDQSAWAISRFLELKTVWGTRSASSAIGPFGSERRSLSRRLN